MVYAGSDRLSGERSVAIKVATRPDGPIADGLRREFALLYGLRHPHIAATLAFGEIAAPEVSGELLRGAPFVVQEQAPGRTGTRCGALAPDEVATVGIQIASALATLVANGLRHGDVTPNNIMVTPQGDATLIDFGLARTLSERSPSASGTLRYLAPEAMRGDAQAASDIYGLGATLYQLANGHPPRGEHGHPLTSPILGDVIKAMTAVDPKRRPSAEECFDWLADFIGTRSPAMSALRDHSQPVLRVSSPRLREQIDRFSGSDDAKGSRRLAIGGAPGSGKSALLYDAIAHAVHRGLRLLSSVPVRGSDAFRVVEEQLGETRGSSRWLRFRTIAESLGHDPCMIAVDDLEPDTDFKAFVDFALRLGSNGPRLLVVAVTDTYPPDVTTAPLEADVAEQTLKRLRPLRSSDREALPSLLRASGGLLAPFVAMVQRYPGDTLVEAASQGSLEPPFLEHDASLPSIEALQVIAQLHDPFDPQTLGTTFSELPIGATLAHLSERGDVSIASRGAVISRRVRRTYAGEVASSLRQRLLDHGRRFELLETVARLEAMNRQNWSTVAPTLIDCGRTSTVDGRYEDALDTYAFILENEPGSVEAKTELARILAEHGQLTDALTLLENGTSSSERLAYAELLQRAGRYFESADRAPLESENDVLREHAEAVHAQSTMLAGRYQDAADFTQSKLDARPDHRYRAELLDVLAMVAFYTGDVHRACELLEDASAIAQNLQPSDRAERIQSHLAICLHKAGDPERAEQSYRVAIDGARKRGDLPSQLLRQINLATLLQERGRFTEAIQSYRTADDLARIVDDRRARVRTVMNLANLYGWLGENLRALELAQSVMEDSRQVGMHSELGALTLICAEQQIALSRLADASETLRTLDGSEDDNSLAQAEHRLLCAQLALRERKPAEAATLALQSAQSAAQAGRESLELSALTFACLAWADGAGLSDTRVPKEMGRAEKLAARRADPDAGWIIARCHAQLLAQAGRSNAAIMDEARHLLSSARSRLSAKQESAYFSLWYREAAYLDLTTSTDTRSSTEDRRDFDRLLAINRELARDHDPQRLLDRIIDAAIALSGAERGFIVLCHDSNSAEDKLEVYLGRNVERESLDGEGLSRSIAAQAIQTNAAVTTVDASGDERFRAAMSVHELKLRSVLCLPLSTGAEALGALYLDHRLRAHAFNDADVALLSAFGDQAAIALANARLVSELDAKARELERSRREVEELNQRQQRELEVRAAELAHARRTSSLTKPDSPEPKGRFGMIGSSEAMQRVYRVIERVGDKDVTVTISGESGTGKELVARAIHAVSERSGAFVPVNCGAIPESLLESELFGHERGAFTGAVRSKAGLFELAHDGTLFLDEIGDMPSSMQVKLLRVLQQREVRRIGGSRSFPTRARIITATHRDLEALVRAGEFREDLWYRLNVIAIRLPSLRERLDDLNALIDCFLKRLGMEPEALSRRARAALLDHAWPGNVRELENEIARAVALADGPIQLEELSEKLQTRSPRPSSHRLDTRGLKEAVEAFERDRIQEALGEHNGKVAAAARVLGLTRAGLYKKLHKHGIIESKR